MISDLKELLVVSVVSVATVLFLCLAATSPGLTWRANPASQTIVSR